MKYSGKMGYKNIIECYEKTLQLNPENDHAYFNIGNSLFDLKEYSEALNFYIKAIEINPEKCKYYFNLGVMVKFSHIAINTS